MARRGLAEAAGGRGGLCGRDALTAGLPAHREFRHKSNITFNDNDTVSFLEYRSFQFQPERSHGLESDYIVMPNILVLVRLPGPRPAPALPLGPKGFRPYSRLPPARPPHHPLSFLSASACLWSGGPGRCPVCLSIFFF